MKTKRFQEHDVVVLLTDIPKDGLEAGDTGTIVHCYEQANAYEVEFMVAGKSKGVVTVEAKQLLKLKWIPALAH